MDQGWKSWCYHLTPDVVTNCKLRNDGFFLILFCFIFSGDICKVLCLSSYSDHIVRHISVRKGFRGQDICGEFSLSVMYSYPSLYWGLSNFVLIFTMCHDAHLGHTICWAGVKMKTIFFFFFFIKFPGKQFNFKIDIKFWISYFISPKPCERKLIRFNDISRVLLTLQ